VGVEIFDTSVAEALEAVIRSETTSGEDTIPALLSRGRLRRLRDAAVALFTPYL
jgi:hypothetical protein